MRHGATGICGARPFRGNWQELSPKWRIDLRGNPRSGVGWGARMMEAAGQGYGYRQLAEEIGAVLQAAAETAEKMQDDARLQAERLQEEAEDQHRSACAEARRIVDEARMEADMLRA